MSTPQEMREAFDSRLHDLATDLAEMVKTVKGLKANGAKVNWGDIGSIENSHELVSTATVELRHYAAGVKAVTS